MSERPCPRCQRDDLDADACRTRPQCVTHHGIHHLDQWGVCADCVVRVDTQLADILDLHALANAPAALHPPIGEHTASGVRRDPPAPVNLAALDLAIGADALAVLEQWERWWREHWALTPYGEATETLPRPNRPTDRTLVHVVGFLRAWWPRAASVLDPPPDEFADEVRQLHTQAMAGMRLTAFDLDPDPDAKEPPDWTIACPRTLDDGTVCGCRIGMRRQPLPIDGRALDPVAVTCPRCRTHWDGTWLVRVAVAAGVQVTLTLAQAMDYYGCSKRTIRRKVAAGLLVHERGRYRVAGTEEVG